MIFVCGLFHDRLVQLDTPILSIVVPCYNEGGNVVALVEAIRATLGPLSLAYEVVFVDDASGDGSWEKLQGLGALDTRIRGLRFGRNFGQSAALWAGIQAARGQYIATLDADLQNDPRDLPAFLEAIKKYDCVCGSRVANREKRYSTAVAIFVLRVDWHGMNR